MQGDMACIRAEPKPRKHDCFQQAELLAKWHDRLGLVHNAKVIREMIGLARLGVKLAEKLQPPTPLLTPAEQATINALKLNATCRQLQEGHGS